MSLIKLGDLERGEGRGDVARGHYERSLEIDERLAQAMPESVQAQRDLSVSLNKLGDLERGEGRGDVARGHYERSLEIRERLAQAMPESVQAQRDLKWIRGRLALAQLGPLGTGCVGFIHRLFRIFGRR